MSSKNCEESCYGLDSDLLAILYQLVSNSRRSGLSGKKITIADPSIYRSSCKGNTYIQYSTDWCVTDITNQAAHGTRTLTRRWHQSSKHLGLRLDVYLGCGIDSLVERKDELLDQTLLRQGGMNRIQHTVMHPLHLLHPTHRILCKGDHVEQQPNIMTT